MIKLLVLSLATMCCIIHAQEVQDPIKDGAKPGRTYLKWMLDINHDGIGDVLVTEKPTADEIKEKKEEEGDIFNSDSHAFAVYIGLGKGGYVSDGGIIIDIMQCYVGYIDEVKKYGIVAAEERKVAAPSGKGLPVTKMQVYCYTVQGNGMKRTNLAPLIDTDANSPVYDKYLSEAKRTKVQLQEVTP